MTQQAQKAHWKSASLKRNIYTYICIYMVYIYVYIWWSEQGDMAMRIVKPRGARKEEAVARAECLDRLHPMNKMQIWV